MRAGVTGMGRGLRRLNRVRRTTEGKDASRPINVLLHPLDRECRPESLPSDHRSSTVRGVRVAVAQLVAEWEAMPASYPNAASVACGRIHRDDHARKKVSIVTGRRFGR